MIKPTDTPISRHHLRLGPKDGDLWIQIPSSQAECIKNVVHKSHIIAYDMRSTYRLR
jgi:hypothetical protein